MLPCARFLFSFGLCDQDEVLSLGQKLNISHEK